MALTVDTRGGSGYIKPFIEGDTEDYIEKPKLRNCVFRSTARRGVTDPATITLIPEDVFEEVHIQVGSTANSMVLPSAANVLRRANYYGYVQPLTETRLYFIEWEVYNYTNVTVTLALPPDFTNANPLVALTIPVGYHKFRIIGKDGGLTPSALIEKMF